MAKKSGTTFIIEINEDKWKCVLNTKRAYIKLHGDDSDAITLTTKKEMHFRKDTFSQNVVAHELFHAYWEYLCLDTTSEIKLSDVEEIMAEFMASNYIKFYDKANLIYKELSAKIK